MKHTLNILVILIWSTTISSQNTILKTNPFITAFSYLNLSIEKSVTSRTSIYANIGYLGPIFENDSAVNWGVGYKYYFKGNGMNGFYAMPRYTSIFVRDEALDVIGVPIGYQWIFKSGFSIDIGLGPGYYFFRNVEEATFDGQVLPTGLLLVGYAF